MLDAAVRRVTSRTGLLLCAVMCVEVACFGADTVIDPAEPTGPVASRDQDAAREYVDLVKKIASLKAKRLYLPSDHARTGPRPMDVDPEDNSTTKKWRNDAREAGTGLAGANRDELEKQLGSSRNTINKGVATLTENATQVRGQLLTSRRKTYEAKGSKGTVGKIVVLLSPERLPFWLASLLAIGGLTILVVHRLRHEFRRVLNGGAARRMKLWIVLKAGVIGLVTVTGVVAVDHLVLKNRLYDKVLSLAENQDKESPDDKNKSDLAELAKEKKTEEDQEGLGTGDKPAVALPAKNAPGQQQEPPPAASQESWQRIEDDRRDVWINLYVQDRLYEEIELLKGKVKDEKKNLIKALEETKTDRATQKWVFTVTGASVTTGILVLATVFLVNLRKRQRNIEFTCPQCLGFDSMQKVGEDGTTSGSQVSSLECTNQIASINDYDEESRETCGFKSRPVYQRMPKLCFPTLGIPASGKTVWMSMLYRQLNLGNFPVQVHFEKIRSESSVELDRWVDDLLAARLDPGATQTDRLPSPLVFNFRDHDRWGNSNLLVNMFDYAGEVTSARNIQDPHRQRALRGDGFVFLLDPSEPFEPQANAMADFREDLRLIRGAKVGESVRVPLAACISKLDHETVVDKLSGTSFYEDLKKIDPTGESLKLSVLKKRSRLMLEFRDILWPGWEFERAIGELLGGRFMFFPMTPFGLDEMGTPLEERSALTPFGILPPLLWLLHMNGYPLLSK